MQETLLHKFNNEWHFPTHTCVPGNVQENFLNINFVLWAAALMVVHAHTKPNTLKCVRKFPTLFQYIHTWKMTLILYSWKITLISYSELFQVHTYSPASSAGKFPTLVLLHFYALCDFLAKWPSIPAKWLSFSASFCTVNSSKENDLHFVQLNITSAHTFCFAWSAGKFPTLFQLHFLPST